MEPTTADVVVIGGGIAGLAAAHRVLERSCESGTPRSLLIIEAGPRLGGTIASERVDGFLIEAGPDSLLTEKPWALALCARLGIEEQLIRTRDGDRRTFVVHRGRLHPLPEGFLLLAPTRIWPLAISRLFTWSGKLRMVCDVFLPRGGAPEGDESLASFVTRRLGREALERVAQPLAGGIYTADPERLSLAATMPRFLEMERRHRSIILAMRRQARSAASGTAGGTVSGARWSLFVSFIDGMQTLVDALVRTLPNGATKLGTRVVALAREADGGWRIKAEDGGEVVTPRLIIATPAFVAGELLAPHDPDLAALLDEIPYSSSATVTFAYARADVPHALNGFGFVVPAIEQRTLIACSFSSVKYEGRAPADGVLLRVFCGGALAENMATLPEADLIAAARREMRELLGITAEPRLVRVHRYPRAMPQYQVGHLKRLAAIDAAVARLGGLGVAGNAYRGVGIPDCVHSGEMAADAVLGVADRPAGGPISPRG